MSLATSLEVGEEKYTYEKAYLHTASYLTTMATTGTPQERVDDSPPRDTGSIYTADVGGTKTLLELHSEDPIARVFPEYVGNDAVQSGPIEVGRSGLGVVAFVFEIQLPRQLSSKEGSTVNASR
jgi:hypothetical protein